MHEAALQTIIAYVRPQRALAIRPRKLEKLFLAAIHADRLVLADHASDSQQGAFDLVFLGAGGRPLHETLFCYRRLAPGGWLCWDGFRDDDSCDVRLAVEVAGFRERVFHFQNTNIAYLQKGGPKLQIIWEGDVDRQHSLAAVNRALIDRLTKHGHTIQVKQTHTVPAAPFPQRHPAFDAVDRSLSGPADVVVRHSWPANLSPSASPIVLIQPWEYGSPPRSWVEAIQDATISEWWAPSSLIRNEAIAAGAPPERVAVVPNGVDASVMRREGHVFPLTTKKRFRFLFVGGTIWRKGFDLLLDAYGQAFTSDDVCLVVKDVGVGQQYRGQTAESTLKTFKERQGSPSIEYLTAELSDADMAGLYRACHCLVAPYRGEGFCMPVAEAMACGLPVMVTSGGATDDWCHDGNAILLPAHRRLIASSTIDGIELSGTPWVLEVDVPSLVARMRDVVDRPEMAQGKVSIASSEIHSGWTWDHVARIAGRRLQALVANRKPPRVSLTMIVKNEERQLPDCLDSVFGLFDEIIVVDTGSTDRTPEIAREYGANVIDFPWTDDFSAARNEALRHARGQWVFWMDADDRLDSANFERLVSLVNGLGNENAAYLMKCRSIDDAVGTVLVDHVRLFRRYDSIRWSYRVHEQILPSILDGGGEVRSTDVSIDHVGYADAETRRRKLQRNLRLLLAETAEFPDDPFTLFNLGAAYHKLGQPGEAIGYLRRCLEVSNREHSIRRKLYVLTSQCLRELGQSDDAWSVLVRGRAELPEDAELLFLEATLHHDSGNISMAENCYRQLLSSNHDHELSSGVDGLCGHLASHHLARLYAANGRLSEAIGLWNRIVAERPDFVPAYQALSDAHLLLGQPAEANAIALKLQALTEK